MKAINFLKWVRDTTYCCPHTKEGSRVGMPSNGELRRWLAKGSVTINGVKPGVGDEIDWPIKELIFFPNGEAQVTIIA